MPGANIEIGPAWIFVCLVDAPIIIIIILIYIYIFIFCFIIRENHEVEAW